MTSNLDIWNDLAVTDPRHTKEFSRAGGFKGKSIKPIYVIRKVTEQFGPCGVGWGINTPAYQIVNGPDGEIAVYCNVTIWHGTRENVVPGVGGDFIVKKNKYGLFADDEAFKKAFTDAVGNALKFLGMSADVYMGLHDDDKYVTTLRREIEAEENAQYGKDAAPASPPASPPPPAPSKAATWARSVFDGESTDVRNLGVRDWHAALNGLVDHAETIAEVNRVHHDNDMVLQEWSETDAPKHRAAIDRMEKRRQFFAQHPEGKTAA